MNEHDQILRPRCIFDVAQQSSSLEEFGMNLRDWQHEIQRGGVRNRNDFARRIANAPPLCRGRFAGGDIADAYLAAYAEWLADRAGVNRPLWTSDAERVADGPWFSSPLRGRLIAVSPASFRQRNIFTIPEPVFQPSRGRPRVPPEQKRQKAIQRQKAYRDRIRELVAMARRDSKTNSPQKCQITDTSTSPS